MKRESPAGMADDAVTLDVAREFHRRMAAIIDQVQAAIWQEGSPHLLGYATDYAFGQQRGVQTLVLKTNHRSTYVRLHWHTVLGNGVTEVQAVEEAVAHAIGELR
jgi:hypothetical protein